MVECESRKGMSEANIERVLIDTWWNVNTTFFIMSINSHFRFNRYMVECESGSIARSLAASYCFNRYMVECECAI